MTCQEARELSGPYVDEALPDETRRRVERHLLTCQTCAWEIASQRITRERLREGIGEVAASDAFRARVLTRLREDNPHLSPELEPARASAEKSRSNANFSAHTGDPYQLPIGF